MSALGIQIDDARLFVDEQPQRGQRQHRARVQRGGQKKSVGLHGVQRPPRRMR